MIAVFIVLLWLILRERSGLTYAIVLPLTALLQLALLGVLSWIGYDSRRAVIYLLILGFVSYLLAAAAGLGCPGSRAAARCASRAGQDDSRGSAL